MEIILHKYCGGELIEIGKCTIYTLDTEVYECQKCLAKIDVTDGQMEFPDADGL